MDLALFDEFRDVCGRVAELIELYDRADILLLDTLNTPLTRDALGLAEE